MYILPGSAPRLQRYPRVHRGMCLRVMMKVSLAMISLMRSAWLVLIGVCDGSDAMAFLVRAAFDSVQRYMVTSSPQHERR